MLCYSGTVKIIDFGISVETGLQKCGKRGTLSYMAPEALYGIEWVFIYVIYNYL